MKSSTDYARHHLFEFLKKTEGEEISAKSINDYCKSKSEVELTRGVIAGLIDRESKKFGNGFEKVQGKKGYYLYDSKKDINSNSKNELVEKTNVILDETLTKLKKEVSSINILDSDINILSKLKNIIEKIEFLKKTL